MGEKLGEKIRFSCQYPAKSGENILSLPHYDAVQALIGDEH